ncbi:hypothetical protein [Pseudomonas chlororaphis]|nr:hypothetical protein [Pseudomonas chlororaphis]
MIYSFTLLKKAVAGVFNDPENKGLMLSPARWDKAQNASEERIKTSM